MARHTKLATHLTAAGLFLYQRNRETILHAPKLAHCAACGLSDRSWFYSLGDWCDDCACENGYLPPTHKQHEERLVFKLMFEEARPPLATWDQVRNLTLYWRANRAALLKGEFDEDVMTIALNAPSDTTPCLWEGCTNLLGATAVAGYCGTTCYARGYRLKNKDAIKVKRMFKAIDAQAENE
jgi:hypothetical protein